MSLRRTCRELVLEVVLRRALGAVGDGIDRLQIVIDEAGLRVLNSFLRMGDLHAEGVTSMELIEQPREPLPGLDALYFLRPDAATIDLVLADFKSAATPQHRQVHFCFTQPLPAQLMSKLAEAPHLAPRVKSFVEVPLNFVVVQDRGFHFDLPEAVPGLFPVPDHQLVAGLVRKLVDVCRCLQATAPVVRHAQSDLCRDVAEQVLSELALHRGSGQQGPPCQLLIVDRSIDVAAALVHEYTYEACVYDLLDGNMLDADRSVITLPGEKKREVLLTDTDPLWEELKHLHLEKVQATVHQKVEEVKRQTMPRDAASMSTGAMLDKLREAPETRDAVDRIFLHLSIMEQVNQQLSQERLADAVGLIEQDIACGVDREGKDVKATNLQSSVTRAFNELQQLSSETKLRLLMLYFASVANISEAVRTRLIDIAQLDGDSREVLLNMVRTRLMEGPECQRNKQGTGCVHRVTKQQAARFKKNALAEGRFMLSRYEPRIKELLEQLAEHRLSPEDFPVFEGPGEGADAHGLRQIGAALETHGAPAIQAKDDWSFAACAGTTASHSESHEVSQRVVVFVLGGFTHSELRAAAEVEHLMPRGTEVLIGGTSLLTPKRLIRALRPRKRDVSVDDLLGADPADLT
eukprot:gb/GFBE01048043.1/.p1 GENE.gb/GFBE01048043.1/~~gb/GFBE01048043.1/.p1  ORF type:complete len:634 (+),score=148.96 gb/GFBE01048043.1/:1-1902(+)